jgi:hypothetical protein
MPNSRYGTELWIPDQGGDLPKGGSPVFCSRKRIGKKCMTTNSKTNIKILFALTLVHFTGDFYSSFTTPLYPLFIKKLDLSLTQIGIISGVMRLLAFIVQPSSGSRS